MSSAQNSRTPTEINEAGVSLCIPFVHNRVNWRKIKQVFISLHWGFVERVDVIRTKGGKKRAFVHFSQEKFTNHRILAALADGKDIKIQYDEYNGKELWWLVRLSRSAKPAEAPKPKPRPSFEIVNGKVLGKPRVAKKAGGRKPVLDLEKSISVASEEKTQDEDSSSAAEGRYWYNPKWWKELDEELHPATDAE